MTPVAAAIAGLARRIADLSGRLGRRVEIDPAAVSDRRPYMALAAPGIWSPNRACRMVRAADGWMAVNLPRESDLWMTPAWIGCRLDADPWPAIVRRARRRSWRELVDGATLLGLPVCGVGETPVPSGDGCLRLASGVRQRGRQVRVLDLSGLWAGPLCGAVLARAGCEVTKIESPNRPDVLRESAPAMFGDLNGGKSALQLDFRDPEGQARLREMFARADVVITSARPRAFEQLGLTPETAFPDNPGLVWVAVTGHGWTGPGALRVAFGDDAAAAGGLVRRTPRGEPRFLGDALADPLTGLFAAAAALKALDEGGGVLVDAAMAPVCARAAAGSLS